MAVISLSPGKAVPDLVTQKFSSSAIAITPDGKTLLTVNPDSNSISIVDLASEVVHEIHVGQDPGSVVVSPDSQYAYVTCRGDDLLMRVRLGNRAVVSEISTGDRPAGVAVSPDGRLIAVAEMGEDRIQFVEAADFSTISSQSVAERPYGLAYTPDGSHLLVTHLLSGVVTVLNVEPYLWYFPLIACEAPTELQKKSSDGYLADFPQSTWRIATWPNVAPAPGVVVNGSGDRAYLPQTMANGLGNNTQFDTTVFPKISVLDLSNASHLTSEHIALPEVDQPVGLPWDAALAKGETELWVINAASQNVSVIGIENPTHPHRIANIPVEENPRGIVISPDGLKAYVNNTLSGKVSVIDTATYAVTDVITVTTIPLPPALLHGKQLYFSSATPDLAQASWISCNTCHIEGEADGRTWRLQYLGSVPPGSQPVITRNTTSLLGMVETYPLRWSAEWNESADSEFSVRFEQFGTGLIDGTMNPTLGAPNQGRSYDLDCLALYIDSLSIPQRTHTLNQEELWGKALFESEVTQCSVCHPAPLFTDLQVHDVGTADSSGEWFGPLIDTPSLRFLYDSAPFLHDGSASTLMDVLVARNPDDEHGITSTLSTEELDALVAYLFSLP